MSTNGFGRPSVGAKQSGNANNRSMDLLCFSHLRWDFVFQRPQHLLSRAAKTRRVFVWEEPEFVDVAQPGLATHLREGVCVVRPQLPHGTNVAGAEQELTRLLAGFMRTEEVENFVAWYYTPMALGFASALQPAVTVYDCMDELSAFKNAPPELKQREVELLRRADVVFTGGRSLFEGKRGRHPNVRLYPSSIDRMHFDAARRQQADPPDQAPIARPRVGFFGVLDERLDRELLAEVAKLRPEIQFVMIGPVVKIDPEELPRAANIHYLGQKTYRELPAYIAGWSAAMLPFAINEATAYISPTKTPEYLAAGRRVVSTPVRDVVRDYGDAGFAAIAATPQEFAAALDSALQPAPAGWLAAVDEKLASSSWDATWTSMSQDVEEAFRQKEASMSTGA